MSHLTILCFEEKNRASQVLEQVLANASGTALGRAMQFEDAAIAVKNEKGKVKITQTVEKGAKTSYVLGGGWWGLLAGIIFGGPLLGALAGSAIAAILGRNIDLGIDNAVIRDAGEKLPIGGSALLIQTKLAPDDALAAAATELQAGVILTKLAEETSSTLSEASKHEAVSAALSQDDA